VTIPSLKVVVAITSKTALAPLGDSFVLVSSALVAQAFARALGERHPILVAMPHELSVQVGEMLMEAGIDYQPIICDPNDPTALAQEIKSQLTNYEFVAVHDSNRPLTQIGQFHATLEALISNADAARASTPFTETLKAISDDGFIKHTIDRTTVRRVSSPEIVRTSAIDFKEKSNEVNSGWFLPLREKIAISYVDSDPESIRVNSNDELSLLASFLHWQKTVAR
jgi:2-C-methyl-D-erythritol 4-phosphate cytidylyltransferase